MAGHMLDPHFEFEVIPDYRKSVNSHSSQNLHALVTVALPTPRSSDHSTHLLQSENVWLDSYTFYDKQALESESGTLTPLPLPCVNRPRQLEPECTRSYHPHALLQQALFGSLEQPLLKLSTPGPALQPYFVDAH